VLFYDFSADEQSQSRAMANFLGCAKRLKNKGQRFFRDAFTGVGDM